ncbi:acyltransferase [Pseudoflavonifractor sp. 524-17]|nr:acyltransferase [Pseudoflavonifractor sp. 524-17]
MKKKFARIFPTYWLAIALAVLLRMVFQQTFAPHPHFWRIFFLIPLDAPYLLNGEWTLLCDMLYYLIGAVFIGQKRARFFSTFLAIWGCTLLMEVNIFYPNLGLHPYLPEMLIAPAHLSFLSGCCAWYAHEKLGSLLQKIPQSGLISTEFITFCTFFYIDQGVPTPSVLVGRFICYFLLLFVGAQIRVSPSNPMVRIGDRSYGMYLSHWTICSIFYPFLVNVGAPWRIAYVTVLCCVLVFSYWYGAIDLTLGATVRRKILETSVSAKKYLAPIFSCLCAVGLAFVVVFALSYIKLHTPKAAFDSSAIVKDASISCGYVDWVEVTQVREGIVQIHADGWGYDPVANQLVNNLILVSDGEIIPATVSWYERSAVGEILNNPVLTTCGWSLNTESIQLEAPADRAFYIPLNGGGYMELSLSPWRYEK